MTKEEFYQLAENRNLYVVTKKLSGELSYADIGDRFYSDTLYARGYNMDVLCESGHLKKIEEPFEWQKSIVGKNVHSVLVYCPECGSWGCNEPLSIVCGNCNYPKGITYYDSQTINANLDLIK